MAPELETPDSPPADDAHDVEPAARGVANKLASRARHVCLLIGAGASCSAGLPTLAGLQKIVVDGLAEPDKSLIEAMFKTWNVEACLSRLRRIHALLRGDDQLEGITATKARELDVEICRLIAAAVDSSKSSPESFKSLASWVARMDTTRPVEVFTINYDLLIERGLETVGVPYFDGFIGGVEAPFMPDLVEPRDAPASRALPSGYVRLWKLHGSTNWRTRELDGTKRTVRIAATSSDGVAAIYPSDEKYDEARRVPFVVLMDRFRRALVEPETITITTGFSFGDAHLNEMLFDAARRHPRSEVVALCYATIPDIVASEAATTRNLVVLSPTEAIIDGRRAPWRSRADIPGVFEDDRLLLGDFAKLAPFLAREVAQPNG